MHNRSSLILLPITIAVIAFVAFSVWIWLSFEKEKSIYGERLAILATGIAYPFDMALRDMVGLLAMVPETAGRQPQSPTTTLGTIPRLRAKTAFLPAADRNDETLPSPLLDALREAESGRAVALAGPYPSPADGVRAAVVEARRDANDQLTGFAVASFSTEALAEWWAQMRRPLDVGLVVLRPGGGRWHGAFLDPDFAAEPTAAAAFAKLGETNAPWQGRAEIPRLLGATHVGLVGWARIDTLGLTVATVASRSNIRGQWSDHYAMLLLPSVAATILVVAVVFWTVRSVLLEAERREAATAALRQSEFQTAMARQHLIDAIESISEGFVLFDKNDQLVLCNLKYRDLFHGLDDLIVHGAEYQKLLAALIERRLVAGVADDPASRNAWLEQQTAFHRRGEEERELRMADGRTILCKEFPMRNGGTVGIRTDITAQKAAEAEIREQAHFMEALLDTIPIPIFYKDAAGRYLGCNKAFEAYIGVAKGKLVGATVYDVAPPELAERYHKADLELLNAPSGVQIYEAPARFSDGKTHTILFHKAIFHDAEGRASGLVGAMLDISERKQAEATLMLAVRTAEIANRSKTEFLANMSHELRTPLNAIIGFSHLMAEEAFGSLGQAQYKEYSKDILQSGHHLLALINDILDVSAIEAGHLDLSEGLIDVAATIAACHRMIRHRAHEAGLTLHVEVPESLPRLFGDERRVRQVLLNLVANAIKFTPAGGRVSLGVHRDGDGSFVFSITDTGIGIAAEDIAKVLEPFGQVDPSLTRTHEGVGLGLPLSRRLVELHGGSLTLSSQVGMGTTVTVRFPASRTRQAA